VFRLRETLLAKSMAPLAAFDELRLYQLSKASSTAQFLERTVGLSPGDAQWTVTMARRLKAMPLTEAAWLAGTLTSGQVHAVVVNVSKAHRRAIHGRGSRSVGHHRAPRRQGHAKAMQSWSNYAQALLADDPQTSRRGRMSSSIPRPPAAVSCPTATSAR
jgi:hypothetical protein